MAIRNSSGYGLLLGKHSPGIIGPTSDMGPYDCHGLILRHLPGRHDTAGLCRHFHFQPAFPTLGIPILHSTILSGHKDDMGWMQEEG